MERRQFKAVRGALRTRPQFRHVLYRDEIERIAAVALGLPDSEPPSSGAPRPEGATTRPTANRVLRQD
jgi:hypothetical protein